MHRLALLAPVVLLVGSASPGAEPILIGHRGLVQHAPENTLPALSACIERNMGFEFDIRTSGDGHLIILHDETLGRTTNGPNRSPRGFKLEQLKRLDAGSWFAPEFADTRIPTLEEVLAMVKKQKRGPTILALNVKEVDLAGEKKLVAIVRKYGLLKESFAFDQSPACSRRLKSLDPQFRIGKNVGQQDLQSSLAEGILDVFLLTSVPGRKEVKLLHQHGKQVLLNFAGSGKSYRNAKVWSLARAARIDGMLTDYPLECLRHWKANPIDEAAAEE